MGIVHSQGDPAEGHVRWRWGAQANGEAVGGDIGDDRVDSAREDRLLGIGLRLRVLLMRLRDRRSNDWSVDVGLVEGDLHARVPCVHDREAGGVAVHVRTTDERHVVIEGQHVADRGDVVDD